MHGTDSQVRSKPSRELITPIFGTIIINLLGFAQNLNRCKFSSLELAVDENFEDHKSPRPQGRGVGGGTTLECINIPQVSRSYDRRVGGGTSIQDADSSWSDGTRIRAETSRATY